VISVLGTVVAAAGGKLWSFRRHKPAKLAQSSVLELAKRRTIVFCQR